MSDDNNAPETEAELFSMKDIRIEVMRARGAGGQVRVVLLALFCVPFIHTPH